MARGRPVHTLSSTYFQVSSLYKLLMKGELPYDPSIPKGYCQCGCGEKTQIIDKNHTKKGRVKGEYNKFIYGHQKIWRPYPTTSYIDQDGYRMLTRLDHPNANNKGRLHEHRYVMSCHLERPLVPGENVHHINGNKLDNRLENLELWTTSQPSGQRVNELLEWAYEILNMYPEETNKWKNQNL